jgi:hypothetical protein
MTLAISLSWMGLLAVSTLLTKRISVTDELSPLSKPMTTRK